MTTTYKHLKPVEISAIPQTNNAPAIFALCEDGSIHIGNFNTKASEWVWTELPVIQRIISIPDDEESNS